MEKILLLNHRIQLTWQFDLRRKWKPRESVQDPYIFINQNEKCMQTMTSMTLTWTEFYWGTFAWISTLNYVFSWFCQLVRLILKFKNNFSQYTYLKSGITFVIEKICGYKESCGIWQNMVRKKKKQPKMISVFVPDDVCNILILL